MGLFGGKRTCPSCGTEVSGRDTKCPRCWAMLDGSQQRPREIDEAAESESPVESGHEDEAVVVEADAGTLQALRLTQEIKSGASWFYFIAGLSAANSVVAFAGGNLSFILALGVTQMIDGAFLGAGSGMRVVGLLLSLTICAGFASCGVFGNRYNRTAFIVGMAAYALDSVVFVLVQDWVGAGLHGVALFFIFKGYNALRKVGELEETLPVAPAGTDTPLPYGATDHKEKIE